MSVGNGTSVHTANPNLIAHGLTAAAQNHPLEAFFGPYNGTSQDMRADDALAHETYNLPESYRGRNKFLERVLDYKIRKEDEFYTRALLFRSLDRSSVAPNLSFPQRVTPKIFSP